MKTVKTILLTIGKAFVLFCSAFIFPFVLEVAFNYTKGFGYNNPEGTIFIPFGILGILFLSYIVFLIFHYDFFATELSRKKKIILLCIYLIVICAAVIITHKTWGSFFKCLFSDLKII